MDLKAGKLVSRIECKARGKTRIAYYVIFITGTGPMVEAATTEGLASGIGKLITGLAPSATSRVAVLALEFPGKNRQAIAETNRDVYPDAQVRKEIYAHRSDEELCAASEQGTQAREGEAEAQLQRYYSLVGSDPTAAHHWLCQSADRGHPDARYRLAILYEAGSGGLEKDPVKAYRWYVLAGESGQYWGGQHAFRLQKETLAPKQLAEAREALQAWRPGQCEVELGAE
jgi:hypothetical protein